MKLNVTVLLLVASALLPGCALDAADPLLESDDLTAKTQGTEDLFALKIKTGALTSAKIRTRFKTKPATLGRFVVGMRTRPCVKASPANTCGAWVASTEARFPLMSPGGYDYDLPTIRTSGTLSVGFESVVGEANTPVVHARMNFIPSGLVSSYFSTGQTLFLYFDQPVGFGITGHYMQVSGQEEKSFAAFDQSSMNASRFLSHVAAMPTGLLPDGEYEEREFMVYARLDAGEKSVLRAEGEHLFVDWCKVDANDVCLN